VRVITFNLRFENDQDGENAWTRRRAQVVRLIERYAPDVLGTQEGRWTQLLYLDEHLEDYLLYAPDRVIDDTCQYPTLFIRRDTFSVEEGEEFWLSRTPAVHRSKNWDSAFPRMMSAARLRCRRTGRGIWAAVTHLDHVGEEARYRQGSMLARWVVQKGGAVVVMGDFNDGPGSMVHAELVSGRTGLVDTWEKLGREEGERSFTHHGFEGIPRKARMDWILSTRSIRVADARILRDREEERYPSDHFPYMADLSLEGDEDPE